jgi:formiminotetrahydrofolate cyclodeaminase
VHDPLELSVGALLDLVADRQRSPGAGSVAAVATAAAAALVVKGARYSAAVWPEADGAAAQAEALRRRSAPLALADARALADAIEALDEPREEDADRRDWHLGRALAEAAGAPLAIAEAAADVATLAAEVADRGSPDTRPDVAAAAALAAACAQMSAHLVAVNLGASADDERVKRAEALAKRAMEAARRALAAG